MSSSHVLETVSVVSSALAVTAVAAHSLGVAPDAHVFGVDFEAVLLAAAASLQVLSAASGLRGETTVSKFAPVMSASPSSSIKNGVRSTAAAAAVALGTAFTAAPAAHAAIPDTSMYLSEKVVKQGVYKEYVVDDNGQQYDNYESTFKSKGATQKGKNKYVAVLGVLLIGSFVIPMLQYFWYVKED